MLDIRIRPEDAPLQNIALQQRLMSLFSRCSAMGLLSGERLTKLDPASLGRLVHELQDRSLLRSAAVDLAPLLRAGPAELDRDTARHMEAEIDRVVDALGESPLPAGEWPTMRELLGDEALAELLRVAPSSLRRYASGARETPQTVAERLHWLAMVVADLSGAYNSFGIRRWFERPRAQLAGRSPREALGADWSVDDEAAAQVRALAAALSGPQALAA